MKRWTGAGLHPAHVLVALGAAACADPTLVLPEASPFPTAGVEFGMTSARLMAARPQIYVGTDGVHRESVGVDWAVYGFQPREEGARPPPNARLVFVERVEEFEDSVAVRERWAELVRGFAAELPAEPLCRRSNRGDALLRRAFFPDRPEVYVTSRVSPTDDGLGIEGYVTTAVVVPEGPDLWSGFAPDDTRPDDACGEHR